METLVRRRLREYRKQRGLTLKRLAEKAGCTPSYLSQVEKGLTTPSLSMIGKLATALNVRVVDIFKDPLEDEGKSWYLARAKRRRIDYPDGKVSSQILVTDVSRRKMEPLISLIEPGGSSDNAEGMTHPPETEEFVLVLKGTIVFQIMGQEIALQQGDTLCFDGSLPHRWANTSDQTAEVLFVFSPPIW